MHSLEERVEILQHIVDSQREMLLNKTEAALLLDCIACYKNTFPEMYETYDIDFISLQRKLDHAQD